MHRRQRVASLGTSSPVHTTHASPPARRGAAAKGVYDRSDGGQRVGVDARCGGPKAPGLHHRTHGSSSECRFALARRIVPSRGNDCGARSTGHGTTTTTAGNVVFRCVKRPRRHCAWNSTSSPGGGTTENCTDGWPWQSTTPTAPPPSGGNIFGVSLGSPTVLLARERGYDRNAISGTDPSGSFVSRSRGRCQRLLTRCDRIIACTNFSSRPQRRSP